MEKETSTSELIERFNLVADNIRQEYNAHLWLIEVFGKRHSYIAGCRDDSFLPPEVIYINNRFAVVSSDWDKVPREKKEEVFSLVKEYCNRVF
ncbi:MAG: hypothetical protein N3D15_03685 [Syntrophorhabdaceae bacterium]|nr:hypothetical protein [Syntrophorhabdaceae bacterium]